MRIVDAVTAVLLCDGELYMTERQRHLTAFPGYHAFPGGKVDREDSAADTPHPQLEAFDGRLIAALVRELREELGYDLLAALADGEVRAIECLGTALSPPIMTLRFDTRFFRIDLRRKPAFTLDAGELADAGWATPDAWLRRYADGALLLAPPTHDVLTALADEPGCCRVPRLGDYDRPGELVTIEPLRGVIQIPVPSNTLPPADRTNAFVLGDPGSARLLIDPSPANDTVYTQLRSQISGFGISEILLTHHHPDHRQFANRLAADLDVPIAMSIDTHARILAREPHWLDGLSVRLREDGDIVTTWLGQPVRVLAAPGHDEGQLVLMPDNRAFCIVGDLIQGIGTVVIAAPEGDMAKYFATLQRVIALAPRVIWPSHGGALGGTFYLEQTLKHRRQREAQVLALRDAGKTVDEMLAAIYPDTDPRLLPLARVTIDSHLAKLAAEREA